MSNYLVLHKNYIFIVIIILLILLLIFKNEICLECVFKREDFEQPSSSPSQNPVNTYYNIASNKNELDFGTNNSMKVAPLPPNERREIDRVYNPNNYPYKQDGFYDQSWYPNLDLPFQVIGGGYRNIPLLGGTQIPILNPPVPIIVDESNIAPNNIVVTNSSKNKQQIGVLYKIYGTNNEIYPLFRRPARRNMNQYDYYTLQGPYGVQVPVVTKNKIDQLDTNDVVFLKGYPEPFRVTIYENDIPSYISTTF